MMTPAQSLSHVLELFQEHFGTAAQSRAFAPGRVEVIGNHTDYNGGTVVGTAIDRGSPLQPEYDLMESCGFTAIPNPRMAS